MPVVGSFHGQYWKARANASPPPGGSGRNLYPTWQASVIVGMFAWWEAVAPIWDQLRWSWRLTRLLWWWRDPADRARLEAWIACPDDPPSVAIDLVDAVEPAILHRVREAMRRPEWPEAQAAVRACATTPKFHHSDQWVAYGRAIRANAGQAQNVFRHLKVVQALQAAHPELSNPEAHLMAELAYQQFAAEGRPERRLIDHPKVVTH